MPKTFPKIKSKTGIGSTNCQKRMKCKPKGMPRNMRFFSMARRTLLATYSGLRMGMMGDFTPSNIPVLM